MAANGADSARMQGIVAENVHLSLGRQMVLSNVCLRAPAGQMVGVTGRSGAGKTTLLRVLAGLTIPDSGTITYGGSLEHQSGAIGLLAQNPRLACNPRWSLRRIIAEPATIQNKSLDVDCVARQAGLSSALMDRRPQEVSDGQLQRACLARLLVAQPQYVLCDEPTAMLDPIAARTIVGHLHRCAEAGAAVVIVSHNRGLIDRHCSAVTQLV